MSPPNFFYPDNEKEDLLRCSAILEKTLNQTPTILGMFGGAGLLDHTRYVLLPQGIVQIGRWRIFEKEWKMKGWTIRFDDVHKWGKFVRHYTNYCPDGCWLEYTDRNGQQRTANFPVDMMGSWVPEVLGELIGPLKEGFPIGEHADIQISECPIREVNSKDAWRKLGTLRGKLVVLGPWLVDLGEQRVLDWGPTFFLLPRNLPDWVGGIKRGLRYLADSKFVEGIGDVFGFPGLLPVLKWIVPGTITAVDVEMPKWLPTEEDFLTKGHPFFGSIYDNDGRPSKWELRDELIRPWQSYVLHNFWVYRRMVWEYMLSREGS